MSSLPTTPTNPYHSICQWSQIRIHYESESRFGKSNTAFIDLAFCCAVCTELQVSVLNWWQYFSVVNSAKEVMFSSLFVCLSVCPLATLRKNFPTDLHEILGECWQWANAQMSKFWSRSGSQIRIQIWIRVRIATLVRRALADRYVLSQCF